MDSASDPDQEYIYFMGSETLPSTYYILSDEYIYFMGSETLPSTYYILSDESNMPFYSTSNEYKFLVNLFGTLKCRRPTNSGFSTSP